MGRRGRPFLPRDKPGTDIPPSAAKKLNFAAAASECLSKYTIQRWRTGRLQGSDSETRIKIPVCVMLTNIYLPLATCRLLLWHFCLNSLPPPKEVMFSLRSVCLFVCLFVCPSDNWKTWERILTKLLGRPRDQWVQFWWRSRSPSGSRSPKSEIRIHWIIELPTDFDEILRTAGVGPRDQLIITFWWRSASLSGSGSLFRITIWIRV